MTTLELAGSGGPAKPTTGGERLSAAAHLMHLIEVLPVCVMRADLQACLLATNNAAVQLLGASDRNSVLGKSLTERIIADHAENWRAFLARAWSDGASSIECEIVDLTGAHRIILVKGVALPNHVDGIESLVLTAQDLASRRRLERALIEHQACGPAIDSLRAGLQQAEVERQRLAALIEAMQAEGDRTAAEHQAACEAWRRRIEEDEQSMTARDQDWDKKCQHLTDRIVDSVAEQQRLSAMLEQHQEEYQRVLDEQSAERLRIEQAVRDECERAHAAVQETLRCEIDVLRSETRELSEDRQRIATQLEQRNAEDVRLAAEESDRRDTVETIDRDHVQVLMKSVAAYRVELLQIADHTVRILEPMATAGRVAMASSGELQTAIEAVDRRSKQLLAQCALDDVDREEIEGLRRDAIEAASLVRQLMPLLGDPTRAHAAREDRGRTTTPPSDAIAEGGDDSTGDTVHLD